jgi:outer membrane immunogenic protein
LLISASVNPATAVNLSGKEKGVRLIPIRMSLEGMMRNSKLIFSVAAAVAIMGSGAVRAADLPVKARPLPVEPVYDWSGFYVGLNGGFGAQSSRDDITLMNNFAVLARTAGFQAQGGFGGGQAGYNWQRGSIVLGVETDIQGSAINDKFARVIDAAGDNLNASKNIDYFGTVRGRLGFASNNVLFYGTGGFAYADVRNTLLVTNGGLSANLTDSSTKTGYSAGLGVEYAYDRSWSFKAEYQYIALGGSTLIAPVVPPNGVVINSNRLSNDFYTLRLGVNYKLNTPVIAKF